METLTLEGDACLCLKQQRILNKRSRALDTEKNVVP